LTTLQLAQSLSPASQGFDPAAEDLSSAPEAQRRSFSLPNRSLAFDTPSPLGGPRDQDHTPGRNPSTAETPAPLQHRNLTSAIRRLKEDHPFLFLEPSREAIFAIKDMPRMRLDCNRSTGEFTVHKSTHRNAVDAATTSSAYLLPDLSRDEISQLSRALDLECRINQFVYHKNSFAIDSVLKVFGDYELTSRDFVQLRASASAYHSDFQSKFLWKGLYPWCKDFATGRVEAIDLASRDLNVPAHRRAFKELMEPRLTRTTYEACWHFIASVCPWEKNFVNSTGTSLQLYFLNGIFVTMTRLMFQLFTAEEKLNRDIPVSRKPLNDRNMRETIRQVYQDLSFCDKFKDVDRHIFNFEGRLKVQRSTLASDYRLSQYILIDDQPPPLPAGLVSRAPIPPFLPPASDASGSDGRGQKRRHSGGQSGQKTLHPNPHPSRRSSKQKRSPAPSHSSLGLSGTDDDENELASSSRRQRGSNHRSQQSSRQDSGHTS